MVDPPELAHLKTANANKQSAEEQEAILSDKTCRLNSEVYFPEDIEEDPDKRQSFFAWINRHGHVIKGLDLSESNITGTEFAELAPSLINLEKLEIREEFSKIENIELLFAHLSKLTKLRTLKISVRNEMTNTIYEHLSKLAELRELQIYAQDTDISKFPEENLIKHLIKLRRLKKLDIQHIDVTENGMGLICELSQLHALTIYLDISNAGLLRHIGKLKQLQI